jgi:hypothetical protein
MKQLLKSALSFIIAGLLAACGGNNGFFSPAAVSSKVTAAPNATRTEIVLKGNYFMIGSAAAKTRAIQRRTGENVVDWPAHGALFAADPSLNGVMVYDETRAGHAVRPYGILAGPNTGLNGPVALATGTDFPCNTTNNNICTPYLWVSNAGNETITYYTTPLTSWNQAPAGTISWSGNPYCNGQSTHLLGSSSPLQFPYGIVDFDYGGNFHPGQIIQTSEANVSGNYWISTWTAIDNGPSQCYAAFSDPDYDTPSGPSVTQVSAQWNVFTANNTSVTATLYAGVPNSWKYEASWSPGPGACTEGTAASSFGNVWVTTNAGCKYPKTDAIWTCYQTKIVEGGCPSQPACTNPVAKLDFPDLPGLSPTTSRLYVPNQNNGTVTAYSITANTRTTTCRPKSIYVNLQTPIGVALQN